MADQQCGLCLSCGAPFLPEIDQVDFFNREGNLSVLFLNTQFRHNSEIQQTYHVPKLCSERQASHMVHVAYHQTALDFMCNRHTGDSDVGIFAAAAGAAGAAPAFLAPGFGIPRVQNAPFLYYYTASTKAKPQAATWTRPPLGARIVYDNLLDWFRGAMMGRHAAPVAQSLNQTYDICQGCNSLMTQKSHFRFLLGLRGAGNKNSRGRILANAVFTQYDCSPRGAPLQNAYGRWHIANNPNITLAPRRAKTDSEAPCIAYYLHMCLPFAAVAANPDWFQNQPARYQFLKPSARALFLQLSWLVLEIACLATLLQEGTVTKRGGKKSHGMHQHRGCLDLYVSYFFWKMVQFEYGVLVTRNGLTFIQWHQKYFNDAQNCPGLITARVPGGVIGRLMFGSTDVDGRQLLRRICQQLVLFYRADLAPLVCHIIGRPFPAAPGPVVSEYFLPVEVVAVLEARSLQVSLFFCFGLLRSLSPDADRRPPATTSNRR